MNRREQREIMRRDDERRRAREIEEWLKLNGSSDSEPIQDVLPNRHRDIRVTPRYRHWPTRVVGVAPGTEDTATEPTVLVTHSDGTSEVRTVASFRKGRSTTRRNDQNRQADHSLANSDLARYASIVGTHKELASE